MKITKQQAADMIRQSGGKIFSVTFTKRSDRRRMAGVPFDRLPRRVLVGRRGVVQDITGEGMAYDPAEHGLLTVREFVGEPAGSGRWQNKGAQWRHIPIEGIEVLRMEGKTFQVE